MEVIVFILVVVGFVLLMTVPFVIAPKMELGYLHKRFNRLELYSVWTQRYESTNPFSGDRVRVINKQMGTDGKTPWVVFTTQFGTTKYMKFKDFIDLYAQI